MRVLSKLKKPKATRILGGALGLLLVLTLVLFPAVPALAAPPMPHWFYGTVTIGTEPAPEGTIVSAQIDGFQYGDPTKGESYGTVDAEGKYGYAPLFKVPADDPGEPGKDGGVAGDIVEFYITNEALGLDGVKANETFEFEIWGSTLLPLTVTIPDTTAPTVTITALMPDPTNVNTPTFTGTAMDTESNISSVEYKVDDGDWLAADAVDGTFDSKSEDYTFTTAELEDGAHTVYVRATDAAENTTALADYDSDEFVVDTTPPMVVSTIPEADAPSVAIVAAVTAAFSEDVIEVNLSGIDIAGATGVLATLDEATDTITIAHEDFAYETSYEVTIPAGAVNDLAGNPLAETKAWSFTTRAEGPVSFTTLLLDDWNLLSTPILLAADSDTLGQIFGTDVDNIEVSYSWDAQNEDWVLLTNVYELLPLYGIYVKVAPDASATAEFVPYQDYSAPPSRALQPGLNLIGPAPALGEAGFPDKPLDQALISIAELEGGLPGYTMVVSPGLNQPGWAYTILDDEVRDLCSYKGYWVVMQNAGTLYGSSTTPIQ